MVTRYRSMRDYFEAQHDSDLHSLMTDPHACYKEIESVSDAVDRMNQNIKDRETEDRMNKAVGVQFGAVIVQGHVIKYPERKKRYVIKIVEEEY